MPVTLPDEFGATMQKLVAQAEKTAIAPPDDDAPAPADAVVALEHRITRLEETMAAGFAQLTDALTKGATAPWQLERMDENLRALRNTESVNQRLFNSLHDELRSYRDNFLRDSLQKPVVRDLVLLLDDLRALAESVPSAGKDSPKVSRWHQNLQNTIHTLVEILHRMEVDEIEARPRVDRAVHRVVSFEPAESAEEDGVIVRRLKRGFTWHEQLLRPEEVVAKRFE